MFENVVPINRARHASTRVKDTTSFAFASTFHVAHVMLQEFLRAAGVYPVVFVEDKDKDQFRPVALLGLEAGENLFIGSGGRWEAGYVPAIIRSYPFALAGTGDEGSDTICIDEASELVSQTEGQPLFDAKGEPSPLIDNAKRYLSELQQLHLPTREFTQYLSAHNMLTPLKMRVRENDKVKNIAGYWVVDEERLNGLSDERFLELRIKRFLPAIYAHLVSLSQIERLVTLKQKRRGPPAALMANAASA